MREGATASTGQRQAEIHPKPLAGENLTPPTLQGLCSCPQSSGTPLVHFTPFYIAVLNPTHTQPWDVGIVNPISPTRETGLER